MINGQNKILFFLKFSKSKCSNYVRICNKAVENLYYEGFEDDYFFTKDRDHQK